MRNSLPYVNKWLLPLSWLYGMGVLFRNYLFDINILKCTRTRVPCICVGNLTVGGTGKTPHTEYLIRLLSEKFKTAMISRGYKRKTKGYIKVTNSSTASEIGDEPWQVKEKFGNIHIAIDSNRCRAINNLLNDEETKETEVILLDDAFQHRYVQAGLNIVLMDYSRPVYRDRLLPAGRLREPMSGLRRANIVIVTKCPSIITPIKIRLIREELALQPFQKLYFSRFRYGNLYPLYEFGVSSLCLRSAFALLVTGIASPRQMLNEVKHMTAEVTHMAFPDHHDFTEEDLNNIVKTYNALPTPRIIITTEKDAARFKATPKLPEEIKKNTLVLPIEVEIINGEQEQFNNKIISYVRKNQRNRIMAES